MFRGIYTATSGMVATSRKQQMLTNNLANAETPGYKQDQTVLRAFPDILIQRIRGDQGMNVQGKPSFPGNTNLGVLHTGVYAQEGIPSFMQGALKATGRNLDLALVDQSMPPNPQTGIQGHVFFAVQKGEGEIRYTRNGQFAIDPEGYLTTSDGYYVLNENQQRIQLTSHSFQVREDGRILVEDNNQPGAFTPAGRIYIGYTEQPEQFVKEGNGLLRMNGGGELPLARNMAFLNDPANPGSYPFQIIQGYTESSNVDVTQTMTDMLSMFRLYEANQKILQAYDRSMEKTVNDVGRL